MRRGAKYLLLALGAASLCACSTMPSMQMSYGGLPAGTPAMGFSGERMHHRAFYEDDDSTPAWMKAVPYSNR